MEYRRWNIAEINYILNVIAEMAGLIKWIRHVQNCDGHDGCHCMLEIVLSIERYMGSRLPWFLDLVNDITMMLEFEDEDDFPEELEQIRECPHTRDYKIGSYWTGTSPDTIRFIKDRMSWAEKIILKQIRNACKYLRLLIAWDLDPETMPYWEPRILWNSLEEPYSN